MSGFLVAKLAAQIVAGLGVTRIVGGIVQNNVVIVTTTQKVLVNAGTFVIGSMLVQQSSRQIEMMSKDAVLLYEKVKEYNETKK